MTSEIRTISFANGATEPVPQIALVSDYLDRTDTGVGKIGSPALLEDQMADLATPLAADLASIVTKLSAAAHNGIVEMAAIERAIDDGDFAALDPEDDETPTLVLAALSKAGIEVADDFADADLEASIAEVTRAVGSLDSLDAYSLYRAEAAHHRVLSRAEETALANRLVLFRRSENALAASCSRITNRIADAQAGLDAQREIIALLADPEFGIDAAMAAGPTAEMTTLEGVIATLTADLARVQDEMADANLSRVRLEDKFAAYNQRLVMFIARKKWEQSRRRADINDLVQEGRMGLVIAIRKFDPSRGYKFSTFATFYIKQKVSEFSLEQLGGGPRIPTHRQRQARAINVFRRIWMEEHHSDPTIADIAEGTGKTEKKVLEILQAYQMTSTASLDKPLTEQGDSASMGDLIADFSAVSPEGSVMSQVTTNVMGDAFVRLLNPRERRVLALRFGKEDDRSWTLEEIGNRMNITRERVRQIEAKALLKLRGDDLIRELADRDPLAGGEAA